MRAYMRKHPIHRGVFPNSNRRGAVAVEMALLAPFLATMIVGITEIGQLQRAECYIAEAAHYGCTTGSLAGGGNSSVISDIQSSLTAVRMTAASATITIKVNDIVKDVSTAQADDKISVTVSIPVSAISWTGTHVFVPASATVSKTVVMLRQG